MFVWPTYSVFFWKKQTPLKAINCEPLPPQDPQVTVKGTSSILPDRPVGLSRRLCGSWYVCLDLLRTNIASCMVKLEAKKPFDPSGWTNQPLCSAVEFITPSQISSAKTAPENPAGIFPCHQWDPVGKICRRSEVSYSGLSSVSRLNQQISPVWACSMSLKVKKLTAGFPPRWRLMMLIYIYIYLPYICIFHDLAIQRSYKRIPRRDVRCFYEAKEWCGICGFENSNTSIYQYIEATSTSACPKLSKFWFRQPFLIAKMLENTFARLENNIYPLVMTNIAMV